MVTMDERAERINDTLSKILKQNRKKSFKKY